MRLKPRFLPDRMGSPALDDLFHRAVEGSHRGLDAMGAATTSSGCVWCLGRVEKF